jgi:hypothetical protein
VLWPPPPPPALPFPSLVDTICTLAFEVDAELCGFACCWTDDEVPFTELGETRDGVVVELVSSSVQQQANPHNSASTSNAVVADVADVVAAVVVAVAAAAVDSDVADDSFHTSHAALASNYLTWL